MTSIGFELYSKQGLSILPGYEFTIAILQEGKIISSSIGKDVYHTSGFLLPDKRISATGRIHYISEYTINPYESFQTIPCHLIPLKDNYSLDLTVKITLPRPELSDQFIHAVYLLFVKKEKKQDIKIPLFLDTSSFQAINPTELRLDVARIIKKHLVIDD